MSSGPHDSAYFRKECDEYWGLRRVRIDADEFDRLEADAVRLDWLLHYLKPIGITREYIDQKMKEE